MSKQASLEALKLRAGICVSKVKSATRPFESDSGRPEPDDAAEARELGLALLEDLFGGTHRLWIRFDEATNSQSLWGYKEALGIMRAVETMITHEWLTETRALVRGEVFTDFVEMAEHLRDEGYKDAAAVIAGSALEVHLRLLAVKANVSTEFTDPTGKVKPKSSDQLNTDLCKAGIYNQNDKKQITAWQGLRNDAAHGHYERVDASKVQLMIGGIRLFISANPA